MSIILLPQNQFHLKGRGFSYIFGVNSFGILTHHYFGMPLPDDSDLQYLYQPHYFNDYTAQIDGSRDRYSAVYPEYPVANYGEFRDYAICVEDVRGVRVTDLRFEKAEVIGAKPVHPDGIPVATGGETLAVCLFDAVLGLRVKLYYTVYADENIITRRAAIENCGGAPVKLLRALSASLDFFDHDFTILSLPGEHAAERYAQWSPAVYGKTVFGNCRGISSHQSSPFVALMRKGCTEESGEVYGCSLIYSGSHYECVEVDQYGKTRFLAGIQPETFTWKLEAGECFETPEAAICYSGNGLGEMSRCYHDFYRRYIVNPNFVYKKRPVVLNSWEGMHFTFDNKLLMAAIDALEGSGIDTFVLDDGWFGARNDATAGLGDWWVNTEKLPNGLKEISDHCRKRGMKFGLWIEPEMINPNSDLFRAHPDWTIHAPDRKPLVARNQCILDLSRREVLDYVKETMYRVISESGADYIKWDANRHLTENWSEGLPADRQGELQHRHILGVYELAKYLTESFPDVIFEGCSGGGGRFDGAMLRFFPQYWTSDNTDAHDRSIIQFGTGLCFPLGCHSCHVSVSPNLRTGRPISAKTRAAIARQGVLGYEFDPLKVSQDELDAIYETVKAYRATEDLILEGDLYRGENSVQNNTMSQTVVSKDKKRALSVFYFALNNDNKDRLMKVYGLDPERRYRVVETGEVYSGAVLRYAGLPLKKTKSDFVAYLRTFEAVEEN